MISCWSHLALLFHFPAWSFRTRPSPVTTYSFAQNRRFWASCSARSLTWVLWIFQTFRTRTLRNRTINEVIRILIRVFAIFLRVVGFSFIESVGGSFITCSWYGQIMRIKVCPFVLWCPQWLSRWYFRFVFRALTFPTSSFGLIFEQVACFFLFRSLTYFVFLWELWFLKVLQL